MSMRPRWFSALAAASGGQSTLWIYLDEAQVEIAAFDREQARLAAIAFGRFGKGIHSKAKLNLADCAAYALAKSLSLPLLFKGDDFAHTDIEPWH
ncbi:type II toxin-antitoxin system VapC family toxin [Rhizobium binxianense]|uniref:type II toxin-antitoxin system VapC family toxin n=1 Tax=Rhizobium binxianense TaxID=3024242 RepID=UPI003159820B